MSEAAISVRGLRKSYGEHEAVSGIDFEVGSGEVFGFLGPNGAGKTTTIAPFSVVILAFVSGVWIPIDQLPHWLEQVGRIFPLFHLAVGLQSTLSPEASGLGLEGSNVAVLAAWTVAGIWVATQRFRWEPQAGTG